MIDSSTIQMLEGRIGFGSDSLLTIEVDENHVSGSSGRVLNYFHKLANLENLYECVNEVTMSKENFDAYLLQLKQDAVKASLTSVLDQSNDYKDENDYSEIVTSKVSLFDEVIGYTLAINVIEQLISSSRINDTKRKAGFSYSELKMELEGVKNDGGAVISQGLQRKLNWAIKKAKKKIFPNRIIVKSKKIW